MSRWKAFCLFFTLSFGFYFGLYLLVISNMHDGSPLPINRNSPSPNEPISPAIETQPIATEPPEAPVADSIPTPHLPTQPTRTPTPAPTDFPFASSRYTELPRFVNFSHRTDLVFDTTQARDRTILVYDVQWVPTVSAIVLIISDRIVPNSRVSIGERPLNNSAFFPNVTVAAQSAAKSDTSLPHVPAGIATVLCTDLEKRAPNGELLTDSIGIAVSVVVCNFPMEFRDLIVSASASRAIDSLLVQFPDLTVELALANPTASKYFKRASRRNPPPLNEPKSTAGVCLVGTFRPSIRYAREIVQYHLTSGMSHVYLSYTGNMISGELLETRPGTILSALRELELTLADYISEGKVSVILAPGIHYDLPTEIYFIDLYAKAPFLQSCLWHSKAYDNYTAVMDFDEIILINDTNKMNITTAIATYIEKQLVSGKRLPQCSMALDLFNTCPSEIEPMLLGTKFPFRETHLVEMAERNKKSIALTQRAKYLGIHSHAKCMPLLPAEKRDNARGGVWDALPVDSLSLRDLHEPGRDLHLINYNFYMFHFYNMYGYRDCFWCNESNTTNEYHAIWFRDVQRELERRCASISPSDENPYLADYCLKLRNPTGDGPKKMNRRIYS